MEYSWSQVVENSSINSMMIVVDEEVYEISQYIVKHPENYQNFKLQDGIDRDKTKEIDQKLLQQLQEYKIGKIQNKQASISEKVLMARKQFLYQRITLKEVKAMKYTVLDGYVYDLQEIMKYHPQGNKIYKNIVGKDATKGFNDANHSKHTIVNREKYLVGIFDPQDDELLEQNSNYQLDKPKFVKKYQKKKQSCEGNCQIF